MKHTAQFRAKTQSSEAGFTLTELLAGLFVASMLIVGLAEITHHYALTTMRVKTISSELRASNALRSLSRDLEQIDPGSLEFSPNRIAARLGSNELVATIKSAPGGARIDWQAPSGSRSLSLRGGAEFRLTSYGAIMIADKSGAPLAIALPARTAPYDCQFDTVTRECR